MRNLILTLLALCVLASCQRQRNERVDTISIDLNSTSAQINPAEFMDITGWIQLDADRSDYIGYAKRLEVFENKYYILDNSSQRCVMVYDSIGKPLTKVGAIGGGPGEYSSVLDFAINPEDRSLIMLTGELKTIKYGLDGTFIKSVTSTTDPYVSIVTAGGDAWMSTNFVCPGKSHLLIRVDSGLNVNGKWNEYSEGKLPLSSPFDRNLHSVGDDVLYVDNVNRNILRFNRDAGALDTIFTLNLPNPMPEEYFSDNMMLMGNQRNFDWILQTYVTKENIFIVYILGGKQYLTITDNKGNTLINGELRGDFPKPYQCADGSFVTPVSIDEYFWYWEKQNIPLPVPAPTENTNLLLVKWKLKKIADSPEK